MSSQGGTFEEFGLQASRALAQLAEWLSGDDLFKLLRDLGLELPSTPATAAIRSAATDLATAVAGLEAPAEALTESLDRASPDEAEVLGASADLILAITHVIEAIGPLSSAIEQFNGLPQAVLDDFASRLARRIIDFVALTHIERTWPTLYRVLVSAGLVELDLVDADPATARPAHRRRESNPGRLKLLFDPSQSPAEVLYNWGRNDLRAEPLLETLSEIGIFAGLPLFYEKQEGEEARITLGPLEVVHRPDFNPSGFSAQLDAGAFSLDSFATDLDEQLSAEFTLQTQLNQSPAIHIRPGQTPTIQNPGSIDEGRVALDFRYSGLPGEKLLIVGMLGGTRLEADAIRGGGELRVQHGGGPARLIPALEASVEGGSLVLAMGDSDSFISTLFSGDLQFDFDFGLGWDLDRGLYLTEGSGLIITIPIQKELGPILIETLHLAAAPYDEGVRVEVSTTLTGELGPVSFAVDRIGAYIDFQTDDPDLPVQLDFRLRPPSGLGLVVDAGGVSGGGYLFFDHAKREYAGVLQLEFGSIALNAVGLLITRLPDGRDGFSLLIIITAEFSPGIQLGYGFSLTGVGGLLGVHRSAVVEALQLGLRSGTLDSILFPRDPVRNAPQILRDLNAVFPATFGRHTFGPMLGIGWGLPRPLIKMELGVLLELPSPLRLILLGRVQMLLPDEELPLARINMDALGVFDPAQGLISLDATLYDSTLTIYTLSGDMAMRVRSGDSPMFALSVGGLHPAFTPPPDFPSLQRVAISMSAGNNPRLRLEAYLALTSNTLQFGARLELYAAAAGFSITGSLGFDALFQFSPFKLVLEVSGRVALKRGSSTLMSLSVRVTLSGVAPWRASGRVTFKVLLFKGSISFNKTFGGGDQPAVPAIEIWPQLQDALQHPGAWSGELPERSGRLVSLHTSVGDSGGVVAHPLGTLTVRQKVVPLDVLLDRVGQARPTDADRIQISPNATIGAGSDQQLLDAEVVLDDFAAAQFQDLTDDEKLSRPSFEPMQSGVTIVGDAIRAGIPVTREVEYEEVLIDARRRRRFEMSQVRTRVGLMAGEFTTGVRTVVDSRPDFLAAADRLKFTPESIQVEVNPTRHLLVDDERLEPDSERFLPSFAALTGRLRESRRDASGRQMQVVEEAELRLAQI